MTLEQLIELCEKGPKRIGIFGGTIDPIHNGHIMLCKASRDEFSLDYILLLVAGDPPHKPKDVSDKEDRFKMAELAAGEEECLIATRIELDRPGKTYTIDTMRHLRKIIHDSCEFFYIVGADTLLSMRTWVSPEEIFSITNFICFPRPGLDEAEVDQYVRLRLRAFSGRIYFGKQKGPEISSTEIRMRVAQGFSTQGLIPECVRDYIKQNNLYRLSAMTYEDATRELESNLSPSRFRHTMGVVEAAVELAERYGVSSKRARWAALLHDCAKYMSKDHALKEAAKYGIEIDDMLKQTPHLLHAPLGAEIARDKYGMRDEGIITAIALHSTGGSDMTDLDKIIYLADVIEENRAYAGVDEIRELATQNLDKAVLSAMDRTICYVVERGYSLHLDTIKARNALLKAVKGNPG